MEDETSKGIVQSLTSMFDNKPQPEVASVNTSDFIRTSGAGTKRALLIAINYFGSSCELKGCHQDIDNMQKYLTDIGFTDFTVLKDHPDDIYFKLPDCPTRDNILAALKAFVAKSKPNDLLYIHYSGHGSNLSSKTEADGRDETWCPVDYNDSKIDQGFIRDDELKEILVNKLNNKIKLRVFSDSCHSSSVLDLLYCWTSGTNYVLERSISKAPDVVCISGCKDPQTSADAVEDRLPQGAATWAFLKALRKIGKSGKTTTWGDIVGSMQVQLNKKKYTQIPQLHVNDPEQLHHAIDLL
jgi:metacaspase-1